MNARTKTKVIFIIRLAVATLLVAAFALAVFVVFEKKLLPKALTMKEEKKENRSWAVITICYYAPIITTCLAILIGFGRKRSREAHIGKMTAVIIGGLITVLGAIIITKKITAGVENAETTVLQYYVIWIVRQVIPFALIAAYQGARAQDRNVGEKMSIEDSDVSPKEADVEFINDD